MGVTFSAEGTLKFGQLHEIYDHVFVGPSKRHNYTLHARNMTEGAGLTVRYLHPTKGILGFHSLPESHHVYAWMDEITKHSDIGDLAKAFTQRMERDNADANSDDIFVANSPLIRAANRMRRYEDLAEIDVDMVYCHRIPRPSLRRQTSSLITRMERVNSHYEGTLSVSDDTHREEFFELLKTLNLSNVKQIP